MEFLDLSDANDDEKADAMAIIGSVPFNGVEFPFEMTPFVNKMRIKVSHESFNSLSQEVDSGVDNRQPAIETPVNSSAPLRHSPNQFVTTHTPETVPQTTNSVPYMEMTQNMSNGAPVVCAPPPQQYIYQTQPQYQYQSQPQIANHYYQMSHNGAPIVLNTGKDMNKVRQSVPGINTGKSGKIHNDIRAPFYSSNQYQEIPQLIDANRTSQAIVSDTIVTMPSVQPMFTPGFSHILPPFAGAQMYLIATPEGSYITYGLPQNVPITQTQQLSGPHTATNGETNSANSCKVPLNGFNAVENEIERCNDNQLSDELSEEPNSESNNDFNDNINDNEIEIQDYNENTETNIDTNDASDVKVSDNDAIESVESEETLRESPEIENNNLVDSTQTSTSAPTTPPANSTSNVWANKTNRLWADLFKDSSAPNHPSLMSSNLSSQTTGGLTTGSIVSHNYNDYNLSESDSHLNSSFVNNSESEAQIKRIPINCDSFARKLSKKVKEMHLKHFLPYLIPAGLVNRGNWCYINATLQALVGCPPFYNLMRDIGEMSDIYREKSSTPIIDSLAKFFSMLTPSEHLTRKQKIGINLTSEEMPKAEPIEPRFIYDMLSVLKEEWGLKGRQEDAEEFLSFILNGLHEEMIALLQYNDNAIKMLNGDTVNGHTDKDQTRSQYNDLNQNDMNCDDDDANLWKEVSSRHKALPTRSTKVDSSPIMEIFGGSALSIITAGSYARGNRQPFFALQLDIQSDRVKSVEDALKCLTTSVSIQDYICPKTKQAIDASAQTYLETLPPILILHLKLFVYDMDGGCRKLMKRIEYPVDLELPRECLHFDKWEREKNYQLKRYKLLSVVYHDGSEAVKGHYVADVYHIGSNQWLRCDDQSVKVINTTKVLNTDSSRTPYLLFYRRYDTLYNKHTLHANNSKSYYH
ncbi:ubiquitin carboxyl-terminal hydrolase 10-like isoform X2 [Oppia nitens]|nr:ubiquitin carboxyl-terminal hydrolase 10-like isoform X2 [Oppia nitens]